MKEQSELYNILGKTFVESVIIIHGIFVNLLIQDIQQPVIR